MVPSQAVEVGLPIGAHDREAGLPREQVTGQPADLLLVHRVDAGEDVRVELLPAASLRGRVTAGEITHGLVLASLFQADVRGLLP